MYFILCIKEQGENVEIVTSSKNKNEASEKLEQVAIEFIKDEEGNKKAETALCDSLDELQNKAEGLWLVRTGNRVTVYKNVDYGRIFSSMTPEKQFFYQICHFDTEKQQSAPVEYVTLNQTKPTVVKTNFSAMLGELKNVLNKLPSDPIQDLREDKMYRIRQSVRGTDNDTDYDSDSEGSLEEPIF